MRAAFCAASRLTGYLPPTSRFASISVRLTSFATPARDDGRWWARQRPHKAAFPEGFRGLIERLNRRVPTKIPTKYAVGKKVGLPPLRAVVSCARSNYQGSLMAISRENILEVDPGTRRPMAD